MTEKRLAWSAGRLSGCKGAGSHNDNVCVCVCVCVCTVGVWLQSWRCLSWRSVGHHVTEYM